MALQCKMGTFDNINFKPLSLLIPIFLSLYAVPSFSNFTTFVFGDSLVDAGNNDYIFTLAKADSPPYGIDFKPSGGHPTGRFTNGRTIAEMVGQSLGAKSYPPPYLAPNTEAEAILKGINYASGASGIMDKTGFFFIGRIPLGEQVNNFEQNRNYMVNAMGENGTREFLKKAVFSLTIGSNDILNNVQPSIPFLGHEKVFPTTFLDFMISNLTLQLEEMGPDAIFVFANSYDVFMDILANYRRFGFENEDEPCCGGYFPPFVCFQRGDANATASALCDYRSKYVFWDAYHPTEDANLIIAKQLVDGDESVSFPFNIRQLYNCN
ncbi:GDSL esterase/lipase [Hibiscus syriacus]|uniref:GDSL esterase/lipase n=1 Tax=Hibiscus syriacus TaxID=106335 RepID=A0A6A3AWM5_HIBSY|nr:GDSL esterase/lipase [Hibiscus syriacus]